MANAVLVIDMLRGFLEEGYPLFCGDTARLIISPISHLLKREIASGAGIFYLCDHHKPDDLEFNMFPPHCIEGTEETEIIPELAQLEMCGSKIPYLQIQPLYPRLRATRSQVIHINGISKISALALIISILM